MSKRKNRKPIPFRNIKRIFLLNAIDIDKCYCHRINNNVFDVYFKGHTFCLKNSVNFIVHNNRVIINIRYSNKKAYTVSGYYSLFSELSDVIYNTISDITP